MQQRMKSYKMANGLEVFTIEKRDIPMVTVLIAVRNGSYVETAENNGLAHLYEHMFFKANDKVPSQPEFLKALDEMGIELGPNMNAYTSTESVRYFFTLHSEYLERGLHFMADALLTPKFLPEELEKERKVVIGEFDRYEASPSDIFFQRSLMKRLFDEHFIRKNVIGTREVILNASQAQMHEIQHRYYIPNNSALFIVGDFDEKTLKDTINAAFARWEPGANPFETHPVPEHPPLKETKSFVESAPVQTVTLVRAYQGPQWTVDDKSLLAFDMLSQMVSFESSEFQKELVHTGLASSAGAYFWSQRYTSPLIFSVETTIENAEKTAEVLDSLIARMAKGNFFRSEDLKIAQNATEVHSAYEGEVGQRYALALASVWTSTGGLDFYNDYVKNVLALSLSDIDQALKRYVAGNHFVEGALVPQEMKSLKLRGQEIAAVPSEATGVHP
jgi:zinc protease